MSAPYRTPPKSRRWPYRSVDVPAPRRASDTGPSSHLGGQFGFAPTYYPVSMGTRGYPRTVRAEAAA